MFKRTAIAGLIPALMVTAVLMAAFMAPAGASRLTTVTPSCDGTPYGRATAFLTASPAQPQHEGTAVTLTGSSTGCSNPQYRFFVEAPGGPWLEARGYGSATFVWNTTNLRDGVWGIGVWVRQIGSSRSYAAYYIGSYRIFANCTSATLSTSPRSPQFRGTIVTLNGSSTGCNTPRYRFFVLTRHGTHWSSFGPYGSATFKIWNTTNYPKGPNRLLIYARQFNSTHTYDSFAVITFYIV